MNIFEQASKQKIRFPSAKGQLTTEQLWDLPLTSRTGFDLDTVAREVNRELRSVTEESFVVTRENPQKRTYDLMLEVIKHVISVKLSEQEDRKRRAENAAERERLLKLLDEKKHDELRGLSIEEISKRIAELA